MRGETKTHERPSERDLFRNIGWIEWPWCGMAASAKKKNKSGRVGKARPPAIGWAMRLPDGRVVGADGALMPAPRFDGYRRYLGGLVYSALHNVRKGAEGGLLVSFLGSNGKDFSPTESRSYRGASLRRSEANVAAYLRLPGAVASPLHAESYQRPIHQPGWFDVAGITAKKQEARAELEAAMADYTGPITKCPTAIAKGAHFFGGVSAGSETKSTPAPIWEAPAKRGLSPLLEAVAAGANLKALGYVAGGVTNAQRAYKVGRAALLAESARLIEEAAKRGEPLPDEPDETARDALTRLHARDAKAAAWQAAKKARMMAANDNDQKKLAA